MDSYDLLYLISVALFLPMILYSLYVSTRVKRVFNEYSSVRTSDGLTGAEIARRILDANQLYAVSVVRCDGRLSDHYDPRDNTVYLSDEVYCSSSVAAVGVAAHETGHALQHADDYVPVRIRSALVPVANFGSRLAVPLLLIGILLSYLSTIGTYVIYVALAFYALSTLFAFVTLPVEYNASRRAKKTLVENGYVTGEEIRGVDKVLSAAGTTYVASFVVSLLYLLRLIAIFGRRRR